MQRVVVPHAGASHMHSGFALQRQGRERSCTPHSTPPHRPQALHSHTPPLDYICTLHSSSSGSPRPPCPPCLSPASLALPRPTCACETARPTTSYPGASNPVHVACAWLSCGIPSLPSTDWEYPGEDSGCLSRSVRSVIPMTSSQHGEATGNWPSLIHQ